MDLHERYKLTPVINLSGPLTTYGTGVSSEHISNAAREALRHEWIMDELFDRAGDLIAQWSGAEAGTLTACSASGVTLAVAACMTGNDLGRVRQLPDTNGMKNEVVIQKGHSVHFGAPVEQMIRLSGANVREVGTVNRTTAPEIQHALTDRTAAAMFVISHHTVQFGFVGLEEFVRVCHAEGVPVIIDGAAQAHQIERMVASGADLIIISGQKYLDAPTAGIVCGRQELVEAVALQNRGIGRPMKIGKEGIFGTMVAIEERMQISIDSWAEEQRAKAEFLASCLDDLPGARVSLVSDQTGQPVTRVRVDIHPNGNRIDAERVCARLTEGSPTIRPRGHHTDEGWFFLEPNHASQEQLTLTAARLWEIMDEAH